MNSERPHISVSALQMYGRCPASFYRRYILGEKRPPGIALQIGSGVHVGAAEAMKEKAATYTNLSPSRVADISVAGFDSRIDKDGVELTADEKFTGRVTVLGMARDRVAATAHYWGIVVQPEYQPLSFDAIEHEFWIPLPKLSRDLMGFIDLIDNAGRVIDWKTSSRS